MADELNVVNDTQGEVVAPENSTVSADEVQAESSDVPAQAEAAPAKQSVEENQAFAQMRRNWEQSQREAKEAQERLSAYEAGEKRLKGLIHSAYGFNGDFDDIADQIEAGQTDRSVSEIRAERLQRLEAENQKAAQDERIRLLEDELAHYRNLAVDNVKIDILNDIKAKYPDCKAKSVDEFGSDFDNLLASGVDPVVAYAACISVQNAGKKPTPPEIGAVNSKEAPESETYTMEELSKMSKAEIHKNWSKVKKSYFK